MATTLEAETTSREFLVVGVGASAGGITALQNLMGNMPETAALALVVVQHLTPDRPSQLVHLVSKWTSMRVLEAADGIRLEPGCVYVSPPGHALMLENGAFVTRPLDGASARAGIDVIDAFFESLAGACGDRAVGVILSGSGSDGAAGAVRIRQAGGMVFVQDPTTAMHDGMPSAAIARGAADRVMPLGSLAQELIACASPAYERNGSAPAWADDTTQALDGILDLIRTRTGFDFSGYKTTPLLWRIQRRMDVRLVPLFRDYETLLHDDPAELESLIRGIPIHVTEFFRDEAAWSALESEVIPDLFREAQGSLVRAWTPACSTGQESYSLAMLLAEHASTLERPADFQVFATDASSEIVARASRGIFRTQLMNGVSAERRNRFFYAADGACRVKRSLREKMVFAPQDLLADPPFTDVDLVTCRNLLIYLEPDAASRAIYLLHSSLRMGGYLFLGKGEALTSRQRTGFEQLAPNARIYRKSGRIPDYGIEFPRRPTRLASATSTKNAIEAHTHEAALEERGLPAALVDEHFQILRLYGDTAPFLRFKAGDPTLNLLQLMRGGVHLQPAAQKAREQECAVVVSDLPDPSTGQLTLSVRITPYPLREGSPPQLLVSFMRDVGGLTGPAGATSAPAMGDEDRDWSEALRMSHEELEASREELQALNEELRASNDQLNGANDELNDANAQLREKIEQLQVQSDVLSSGEVMTLFLDEELRVRWFTPAVNELFPLKPGDIGRRITDLAPRFARTDFSDEVRAVMADGKLREVEVRTFDGRWYLQRIRPFREGAGAQAAGVAINFTDVTALKDAQEAARETRFALAAELEDMQQLHAFSTALMNARDVPQVLELALDAIIALHRADMGNIQLYDAHGEALHMAAHREFEPWFVERMAEVRAGQGTACGRAMAKRERVCVEDMEREGVDTRQREIARRAGYRAVQSTPLTSASGQPLGMISTHFRAPRRLDEAESRLTDILANELSSSIERVRAEQALRESERTLRRNEAWLAAHKEAFQSAMNGDPLDVALGVLARAIVEQSDVPARCAFYIADASGKHLTHLVGMSEEYAKCVDGFQISPESLACGLAVATGSPVVTRDVMQEPRWLPWTWLARDYGYRGFWSFPVETSTGRPVGSFAMYFAQPREPTPHERDLVGTLTKTAAIIISRHEQVRAFEAAAD